MLHRTTTANLNAYKYSESEIYFIADGLLKKATIESATYSAGSAVYNLKATLAWGKLQIKATTKLVSPNRRLLPESNFRVLETAVAAG